jgi:hypothetical protein
MKRNLFTLSLVALFALAATFVSCENPDDDNNKKDDTENPGGGDDDPGKDPGGDPERLITAITEIGEFNSDKYAETPFKPVAYEFKYYQSDGRLKELHIKDPENEYGNYVYTYDYTTLNEVRVSSNYDEEGYTGSLGANGYVSRMEGGSYEEPYVFTYDADGYLQEVVQNDTYTYTWQNGNLVELGSDYSWVGYDAGSYTAEKNNKTNIDLNIFLLNIASGRLSYYPVNLFTLIDKAGKRSANYAVLDLDLAHGTPKTGIYTAATEPAQGVIDTRYDGGPLGDDAWVFDAEGWPTAYTWTEAVTKVETIYEGERNNVEPQDEDQRRQWTEEYGPGPWFTLVTTYKTYPAVNDTYTYAITYNK